MGVFRVISTSDDPVGNGQPNPTNYHLERYYAGPGGTALWLRYPDCKNFEGNKILVITGTYVAHDPMDPHFEGPSTRLIARFVPTAEGWSLAKDLVERLGKRG